MGKKKNKNTNKNTVNAVEMEPVVKPDWVATPGLRGVECTSVRIPVHGSMNDSLKNSKTFKDGRKCIEIPKKTGVWPKAPTPEMLGWLRRPTPTAPTAPTEAANLTPCGLKIPDFIFPHFRDPPEIKRPVFISTPDEVQDMVPVKLEHPLKRRFYNSDEVADDIVPVKVKQEPSSSDDEKTNVVPVKPVKRDNPYYSYESDSYESYENSETPTPERKRQERRRERFLNTTGRHMAPVKRKRHRRHHE